MASILSLCLNHQCACNSCNRWPADFTLLHSLGPVALFFGRSLADPGLMTICVAVIARLQHVRLSRLWNEQKADSSNANLDVLCCEGNNGRPPRRATYILAMC